MEDRWLELSKVEAAIYLEKYQQTLAAFNLYENGRFEAERSVSTDVEVMRIFSSCSKKASRRPAILASSSNADTCLAFSRVVL